MGQVVLTGKFSYLEGAFIAAGIADFAGVADAASSEEIAGQFCCIDDVADISTALTDKNTYFGRLIGMTVAVCFDGAGEDGSGRRFADKRMGFT